MQIALNNGTAFEVPLIDLGDLNGIWYAHPIDRAHTPCWYYRQGSGLGMFGVLQDFVDEVDNLNNPYNRPSTVKGVVDTLHAIGWHNAEYFEEGNEGYDLLVNIQSHVVWIVGSFEKGGLAMCKVGSEYAFISFDGRYEDSENGYVYYGFYTGCAELSGEWMGTYTYTELQLATLCNYTDIDNDSPPIWIAYQPEGYVLSYISDWELSLVPDNSYQPIWLYDSIAVAMGDAKWIPVNLGLAYFPNRPFGCADLNTYTFDATKGVDVIAYSYEREGYTGDGRDIYGGAEIDEDDNPFSHGGYNTNGGGGGAWDDSSDQGGYTKPSQFTTDALSCGFFTVYNPSEAEIKSFNNYIFTDITDAMASQLKKLIADPIDYVIFLAMIHFHPTVKNAKEPITFCGLNTGVTANVVKPQMQFVNCGTVYISEHRETASFLSYDPYFTAHLYLPYIGIVDISIDDIMDCYITIQYIIDMLSGACIAQVIQKRTTKRGDSDILNSEIVIGEYTGNCFENLPLSATDWRGLFQGIIQFAGGLVSTAGGNAAGLGAMASAVMSDKVRVSRSGQLGANYGYIGFQKPYFLFERSNAAIAGEILGKDNKSSYGGWQGWTCNIIKKLGLFKGYTEIRPECLWVDKIDGITEEEAQMLRDDFANGVYLNWE